MSAQPKPVEEMTLAEVAAAIAKADATKASGEWKPAWDDRYTQLQTRHKQLQAKSEPSVKQQLQQTQQPAAAQPATKPTNQSKIKRADVLSLINELADEAKQLQQSLMPLIDSYPEKMKEAKQFRDEYRQKKSDLFKNGQVQGKNKEERDAFVDNELLNEMIKCHQAEAEENAFSIQLSVINGVLSAAKLRGELLINILQYVD